MKTHMIVFFDHSRNFSCNHWHQLDCNGWHYKAYHALLWLGFFLADCNRNMACNVPCQCVLEANHEMKRKKGWRIL